MEITIGATWDGRPVPEEEWVYLRLDAGPSALCVELNAPYCDDSPPPHAAASTWGLWEYEVVELFFLGMNGRYTEIEVGPHGHFLVLRLEGERTIIQPISHPKDAIPLDYKAQITGKRWQADFTFLWMYCRLPFPGRLGYCAIALTPTRFAGKEILVAILRGKP